MMSEGKKRDWRWEIVKRRDDRWPAADEIIRWNDEGEHRCRLQTSDKRWYAEDK